MNVDTRPIRVLSLFSGVSGLGLGIKIAVPNSRHVCYVEREFAACEILGARMAEGSIDAAPIFTDITHFDGRPWRGSVDFIEGGFPCVDLSVAGKQRGITGERSGLWFEYLRIIREVQPAFVFIENVPPVLSFPAGGTVLGGLAEERFNAEWITLPASGVGASHRRSRVFVLAYRESGRRGVLRQSSGRNGFADWRGSSVADTSNGQFQESRRGPQGRNGSGPAGAVLDHAARDGQPGRNGEDRRSGWRGVRETGESVADAGRTGSGRSTQPSEQCGAWTSGHDSGTGGAVGHADEPGLEGRSESGQPCGTGRQRTGVAAGTELADAECTEWRPDIEHDEYTGGRIEATGGPGCAGEKLADASDIGHEWNEDAGRKTQRWPEYSGGDSLPIFAPGPGDTDFWRELLVRFPWLRPALSQAEAESDICDMADGLAALLGDERTDALRAVGNGVVALQCSLALVLLAERAGITI